MKKERLVVVHAQLAFAVPADATDDEVLDHANCMLIPHQREHDGDSSFIDYAFGDTYVSPTAVDAVTRNNGFEGQAPQNLSLAHVHSHDQYIDYQGVITTLPGDVQINMGLTLVGADGAYLTFEVGNEHLAGDPVEYPISRAQAEIILNHCKVET